MVVFRADKIRREKEEQETKEREAKEKADKEAQKNREKAEREREKDKTEKEKGEKMEKLEKLGVEMQKIKEAGGSTTAEKLNTAAETSKEGENLGTRTSVVTAASTTVSGNSDSQNLSASSASSAASSAASSSSSGTTMRPFVRARNASSSYSPADRSPGPNANRSPKFDNRSPTNGSTSVTAKFQRATPYLAHLSSDLFKKVGQHAGPDRTPGPDRSPKYITSNANLARDNLNLDKSKIPANTRSPNFSPTNSNSSLARDKIDRIGMKLSIASPVGSADSFSKAGKNIAKTGSHNQEAPMGGGFDDDPKSSDTNSNHSRNLIAMKLSGSASQVSIKSALGKAMSSVQSLVAASSSNRGIKSQSQSPVKESRSPIKENPFSRLTLGDFFNRTSAESPGGGLSNTNLVNGGNSNGGGNSTNGGNSKTNDSAESDDVKLSARDKLLGSSQGGADVALLNAMKDLPI